MLKKCLQFVAVSMVAFFAITPVVSATNNHNPAGNNGFVKINDELAPDETPENNPHVDCTFSVEFYNYDKGNYNADVQFSLQQPTAGAGYSLAVTSGNLNPFIGGDSAGGGNDLDASEIYKLTFTGAPHNQQGYHVKLTVHAPGSQGSDKKQKVFWVSPCTEPDNNNPDHAVLGVSTTTTPSGVLPVTGSTTSAVLLIGTIVTIVGYVSHYAYQFKRR